MANRSVLAMFGLVASLAGCRQILGLDDISVDAAAPPDDMAVPPDTLPCFGALAHACFDPSGAQDVTLDAAIDTDNDPRCIAISHPGQSPDLCVIFGSTVRVNNDVVATGGRALVLVALDHVTVGGKLDVSSAKGSPRGAGAAMCSSDDGKPDALGGGGGAGGTFGGLGGHGGDGANGGKGGLAGPIGLVTNVRGGCDGGKGGVGLAAIGGAAGAGGGAVSIVAGNRILIFGSIAANGMGGGGGAFESGGGGGGAGGLIALEAPDISVPGMIAANSGAGGEGAGQNMGNTGGDGDLPYDKAAIGGNGASGSGGDGGDGTAGAIVDGEPGANGVMGVGGGGAGGGGGGAGVVWVKGVLSGTRISPAPTLN